MLPHMQQGTSLLVARSNCAVSRGPFLFPNLSWVLAARHHSCRQAHQLGIRPVPHPGQELRGGPGGLRLAIMLFLLFQLLEELRCCSLVRGS